MTVPAEDDPHLQRPAGETESAAHAHKPVRLRKWMIIVGGGLAVLVFLFVGFNAFREHMIAQFFANMKPPPVSVAVVDAKSEVLPNLITTIGDLAAVHQVDVSADVSGRVTQILFTAGATVKKGDPLVQLFDAPDQADLVTIDFIKRGSVTLAIADSADADAAHHASLDGRALDWKGHFARFDTGTNQ